jgi:hypothetical protein
VTKTTIGRRLRESMVSPAITIPLAAVCSAAVLAGLSLIAGWHTVTSRLTPHLSWWFAVAFVAEAASFCGYVFCYRSVSSVRGGRELPLRRALLLVAIGFGAFLAKGGAALDARAVERHGGDSGEARVMTLDALEHAPLAPAAWLASIALIAQGRHVPG